MNDAGSRHHRSASPRAAQSFDLPTDFDAMKALCYFIEIMRLPFRNTASFHRDSRLSRHVPLEVIVRHPVVIAGTTRLARAAGDRCLCRSTVLPSLLLHVCRHLRLEPAQLQRTPLLSKAVDAHPDLRPVEDTERVHADTP
ncbi:hypothetical protein [Burkholderia sp. Bp8963]|uniref:hypothetical protein n=1 Tax=Burkholderia sp. Bp8963 TaxID=2184547 RepID=UPI000F591538|nr:hypothetical protein [Burkholderia sp. Bp8963]